MRRRLAADPPNQQRGVIQEVENYLTQINNCYRRSEFNEQRVTMKAIDQVVSPINCELAVY